MKNCRKLLLFIVGLGLFFSGCRQPVEPFQQTLAPGETVFFVPNSKKMIALTFDDGPNGNYTEQILNALKERHVPAAFFIIDANAERYPEIVRRMVSEGHLIGNHTFSHPRFDQISTAEIEKDIADGSRTIEALTGIRPRWFRPPFGINGASLANVCRQLGLVVAGWSLDANDWNPHPVEDLVEAIVSQAVSGDIILLHDGWETRLNPDRRATVAAVPIIVDKLKEAGFIFVPLPELLSNAEAPMAVFENGVRLLGMQIPARPVYAGDKFRARYFWKVPENYTSHAPKAFVHFVQARGNFFFQNDHFLSPPGDVRDLVVRHTIHVPGNAPQGQYEINIGLFYPERSEAKKRLKVRSNFPQSKRALHMPSTLEIAPAAHK